MKKLKGKGLKKLEAFIEASAKSRPGQSDNPVLPTVTPARFKLDAEQFPHTGPIAKRRTGRGLYPGAARLVRNQPPRQRRLGG
jgi:hypothetical protein